MITSESAVNATFSKSSTNNFFGPNQGPQEQIKPPETPVVPIIPDNDAEIASINSNPLREEFAGVRDNLHRYSTITSAIQNYRQLFANLTEKRDQISGQAKERAQMQRSEKDIRAQQQAVWEEIEASNKQINDIVGSAHSDGNKILTTAGQNTAISVGDDAVTNIPAQNLGVNLTDVDLSENPDTLLEKIKRAIQEIMDNGEFLLGVKVQREPFTTMMEFELRVILNLKEYMAENMTLELAKFTTARVLQETRQALQSQAYVTTATAVALLINRN